MILKSIPFILKPTTNEKRWPLTKGWDKKADFNDFELELLLISERISLHFLQRAWKW